jgi:hypothetical protein
VAFIVDTGGGGDGAKTTPPSPVPLLSTLAPAGAYPYVAILAIGTSKPIGVCDIAPYAFATFSDAAAAAAAVTAAAAFEHIPYISVYDASIADVDVTAPVAAVSILPRFRRPLPDASSARPLPPRLGIPLDSMY